MLPKEQWPARLAEWADIEFRLSFSGIHTKRELKVFQDYFVKYKEPSYEHNRDPIPLLYRLWLCPDQSDESWEAVLAKVLTAPQAIKVESIRESQVILFQEADSSRYDGVDGAPLGFMGGVEKRLVDFFSNHIDHEGNRLIRNSAWNFGVYEQLKYWLNGQRCNPYQIARHMISLWVEKIQNPEYINECAKSVVLKKSIIDYFKVVKSSHMRDSIDQDLKAYAAQIACYMSSPDAPELLRKWWAAI